MKREVLFIFGLGICSALGCSDSKPSPAAQEVRADTDKDTSSPPIENLLKITDKIYCGGEPHDEDAFAQLAVLGIRTVVSVDGVQPDVDQARAHGLRYVHIPIGYDGIDEYAGLSLARLVQDADGPVFIHCHHGRHRGPAAAAIACLAAGEMDHQAALTILERAGTSKDYAGLWQAVETYRVPGNHAVLPDLVETAEIASFAAAMAQVDRAFANLKRCRDAEWTAPSIHPDLIPHQQAKLLKEGLRESRRNLTGVRDSQFSRWLEEAEWAAQNVETALTHTDLPLAEEQFQVLSQSCTRCHEQYRN